MRRNTFANVSNIRMNKRTCGERTLLSSAALHHESTSQATSSIRIMTIVHPTTHQLFSALFVLLGANSQLAGRSPKVTPSHRSKPNRLARSIWSPLFDFPPQSSVQISLKESDPVFTCDLFCECFTKPMFNHRVTQILNTCYILHAVGNCNTVKIGPKSNTILT